MNKHEYKKLCIDAMRKLIECHGYKETDFTMADGDEILIAPMDLVEEDRKTSRHYFNPEKGTPIIWTFSNDDGDCDSAYTVLQIIRLHEDIDGFTVTDR